MRQTIPEPQGPHLARFLELLVALGRKNCLRDPVAMIADRAGLTGAQLHAILWLGRDAPLTMGVLAQRSGVTEKTITGIVDRLERAKYVQRERHAEDRRVVQVVLTRQGRKLYEQLDVEIRRKLGNFLLLIDDQDREALFRILEKLTTKLEAEPVPPLHSSNED
jgi:DNA-binding MarR family transcriptional regulator